MSLFTLSNEQKAQVRNAFTLIDSDSKDNTISASDLANIHKTLGLEQPPPETIAAMLGGQDLISFAQFSHIMAAELAKLDDKATLANAFKVFSTDQNRQLAVDADELKEACCAVQLGEIGSGDNRLNRAAFDTLAGSFVKEEMDGRRVFHAQKWIDAYIE